MASKVTLRRGLFGRSEFDGLTSNLNTLVDETNLNSISGVVNVKNFGAKGDNTADDTAAIQAAINYAINTNKGRVYLPPGLYKISNTLHVGYGDSFTSCTLEGDMPKYAAGSSFNGAALIVTFSDRQAISVQGARGTVIRNLSIKGLLESYISTNNLGTNTCTVDDTLSATWNDASLNANQDSRYAPYAAITIDAFSGTAPSPAYPSGTYGKNFSSDVLIENVDISGFNTAIVVQPCNADGNGDFTVIRRLHISFCKYGISIGNSQSRNVTINDVKVAKCFCVLTNKTHGKQIGKFNSTIDSLSMGEVINIFDFTNVYAGPVVFSTCYAEVLWRIGNLGTTSSNDGGVIFNGCSFNFDSQTNTRGVPVSVLTGGTADGLPIGNAQGISFNECVLRNFPSVIGLPPNTILNNTFINSAIDGVSSLSYVRHAHNALAGGVFFSQLTCEPNQRIQYKPFNLDTGNGVGSFILNGKFSLYSRTRNTCIPLWADFIKTINYANQDTTIFVPRRVSAFSKTAAFSSISLSNKTLTLVFNTLSDVTADVSGLMPGDVLLDDDSGSLFFIKSRSTTTVEAVLQNNYKSSGGGNFTTLVPFSTTVGNLYSSTGRLYSPSHPMFANLTSGSATAATVERGDGFSGFIESDILVDDRFYVWDHLGGVFPTNNKVVSRSNSSKEIVFSSNATQTRTKERLVFFLRQAPANNT